MDVPAGPCKTYGEIDPAGSHPPGRMLTLRRSARIAGKNVQELPEGSVEAVVREEIERKNEEKKGGRKEKREKKRVSIEPELEVIVEEEVQVVVAVKNEKEDEDKCSVCMDSLSSKRVITFNPCSHIAHRTCGIKWLETRESDTDLSCPVCRTTTTVLVDRTRPSHPTHLWLPTKGNVLVDIRPLGPLGQPTKFGILNDMGKVREEFFHNSLRNRLSSLSSITTQVITDLKLALVESKSDKKGKEYVVDIREELAKMKKRARILADMTRIHKRGGMRRDEMDDEEVEWNYVEELAALRDL